LSEFTHPSAPGPFRHTYSGQAKVGGKMIVQTAVRSVQIGVKAQNRNPEPG
jgi:hypothetical protein